MEIKNKTYFFDIDGTIFIYREFINLYNQAAVLIDGVLDWIKEIKAAGGHIVITTARPKELAQFTVDELSKAGIDFDQIIYGIGRGERVIVNDCDSDFKVRASAIPLLRNEPIHKYYERNGIAINGEDDWRKKYHVKSSMPNSDDGYTLFIGRWQPLHDGHKIMFDQELSAGRNICIAVRDMPADEKNPFNIRNVVENIGHTYMQEIEDGKVQVVVLPNITAVAFGRGVGYNIIEYIPPAKISEISATKIRQQLNEEGKTL